MRVAFREEKNSGMAKLVHFWGEAINAMIRKALDHYE